MVFVVAEIGVNWDGDFELAKDMMYNAKKAGCDAVKFQAYLAESVEKHPQYLRLLKTAISPKNIKKIDELAKSVGIEWFCTPMYPQAVEFLNPYVKKFKIRVHDGKPLFENKKSELISKVLETGKEVIISSQISPRNTKYFDHPQISWLYCVPKYPCNFEDLDFSSIRDFDGYSNHCTHFLAPLTAVSLGAKIIEVHITSDKSQNFIDNAVSFDYNELTKLVELVRLSEKIRK
ncbi:MAG: N-acetylneuraminate synthase family protein [Candidatus Nitrosotenuis sp.]